MLLDQPHALFNAVERAAFHEKEWAATMDPLLIHKSPFLRLLPGAGWERAGVKPRLVVRHIAETSSHNESQGGSSRYRCRPCPAYPPCNASNIDRCTEMSRHAGSFSHGP